MNKELYIILILGGMIIACIFLIIAITPNKKGTSDDKALYDIDNDKAYRTEIYKQISVDFKPYLQHLLNSLDELTRKVSRSNLGISQAHYDAIQDVFKNAEILSQLIDEYWRTNKFKKDFSYYIGLHYASHLLANILKAEQQNIKKAFVECKNRQNALAKQIEMKKRCQEKAHGTQRHHISKEIGDLCKHHQSISIWKSHIGGVNSQYNQRVTNQNIKTATYRDYIASHFGVRGQKWKNRCRQRAIARQ